MASSVSCKSFSTASRDISLCISSSASFPALIASKICKNLCQSKVHSFLLPHGCVLGIQFAEVVIFITEAKRKKNTIIARSYSHRFLSGNTMGVCAYPGICLSKCVFVCLCKHVLHELDVCACVHYMNMPTRIQSVLSRCLSSFVRCMCEGVAARDVVLRFLCLKERLTVLKLCNKEWCEENIGRQYHTACLEM